MQRYIAKRLLLAIPTVLGAITLVFLAMQLAPGDPVRLGEKELGQVGSTALSPALGHVALAILRKEAEPGGSVIVETAGGEVSAEVVELPFTEAPGL